MSSNGRKQSKDALNTSAESELELSHALFMSNCNNEHLIANQSVELSVRNAHRLSNVQIGDGGSEPIVPSQQPNVPQPMGRSTESSLTAVFASKKIF